MKRALEGRRKIAGFMDHLPLPGLFAMQYPTGDASPRPVAGAPPGLVNREFRDRNSKGWRKRAGTGLTRAVLPGFPDLICAESGGCLTSGQMI
jgi:hypothetical protein